MTAPGRLTATQGWRSRSSRRSARGGAATRPALVWSFDRFRRDDCSSLHGGDQGFRGISSFAALSLVFHGPWSPPLPLTLGPLSRKRSEEKLIGRGLRIMSNVTVYSRPSCVQCTATYRKMAAWPPGRLTEDMKTMTESTPNPPHWQWARTANESPEPVDVFTGPADYDELAALPAAAERGIPTGEFTEREWAIFRQGQRWGWESRQSEVDVAWNAYKDANYDADRSSRVRPRQLRLRHPRQQGECGRSDGLGYKPHPDPRWLRGFIPLWLARPLASPLTTGRRPNWPPSQLLPLFIGQFRKHQIEVVRVLQQDCYARFQCRGIVARDFPP